MSFEVDTIDWDIVETVTDSNNLEPPAAYLYRYYVLEQIELCRNCGSILKCGDEHISHAKFQHEITCENCSNISINVA